MKSWFDTLATGVVILSIAPLGLFFIGSIHNIPFPHLKRAAVLGTLPVAFTVIFTMLFHFIVEAGLWPFIFKITTSIFFIVGAQAFLLLRRCGLLSEVQAGLTSIRQGAAGDMTPWFTAENIVAGIISWFVPGTVVLGMALHCVGQVIRSQCSMVFYRIDPVLRRWDWAIQTLEKLERHYFTCLSCMWGVMISYMVLGYYLSLL